MSRCHNLVKPSPRARSPAGSRRSATPCRPTSHCSKSAPTRSTPRCPRPIAGTVTEIRVQEGDTVPVGAVIAVVGEAAGAPAPAAAPRPLLPTPRLPRPHRLRPHRPTAEPAAAGRPPASRRRHRPSLPPSSRQPHRRTAAPAPPPTQHPRRQPPTPPSRCRTRPTARQRPSDNRLLSPVVRRLVAEHNINVDLVKGTGPRRADHPRRRARLHRPGRHADPAAGGRRTRRTRAALPHRPRQPRRRPPRRLPPRTGTARRRAAR